MRGGRWREARRQSRLEARGFDVRVRMQGLAELPEVRQRFVEKAKDALERGDG